MRSANFLAVSVLSSCHPPLLLPGCGGSAPCAISGHDVSLQPENQAARANCWLAILFLPRLTILSKSGRTLGHRNSCRNLSAPITSMHSSPYRCGWVIDLARGRGFRCRKPIRSFWARIDGSVYLRIDNTYDEKLWNSPHFWFLNQIN